MSIHEFSVKFASYLARELGSDSKQELRMVYGLEVLLGEIVKMVVLLLLSWKLGILVEVIFINIAAGFLRLASGGEHCSEYYRCLIGGTACFILLGWGVHYINIFFIGSKALLTIGISILLSMSILWQYAPGETENKPIKSEEERTKFRRISILIVSVYGFVMFLSFNNYLLHPLVLPVLVGMVEQAFTVSPWGYRFMHFVDGSLNYSKWSKKKYDSKSADS